MSIISALIKSQLTGDRFNFPDYSDWNKLNGTPPLKQQLVEIFSSKLLRRFPQSTREHFQGKSYLVASSQDDVIHDSNWSVYELQGFILFNDPDNQKAVSCIWYGTGKRFAVYIQGFLKNHPVFMNQKNYEKYRLTATQVVFNDVFCIMIEINLDHEKIERRRNLSRFARYDGTFDSEYETEINIHVSTDENPGPHLLQNVAFLNCTDLHVISGTNCVLSLSPEDQVSYHIIQERFDEPPHFTNQHIKFEVKRIGDNEFTIN